MRIATWNVNGLRSAYKKNFLDSFLKIEADIFCVQELRARPEDLNDELIKIPGYFSFFNPSLENKGHSGTAVYSKIKPEFVSFKIGFSKFDRQGRVLILDFSDFYLINLYLPHGGRDQSDLSFKLESYSALIDFIKKKKNKKIVLAGDFNIAREEIDLARPKENRKNIMFTEEERLKIDELIKFGFSDVFRFFNKEGKNYTWWPFFVRDARERNLGWRIDYIFSLNFSKKEMQSGKIWPEIKGSDHCPVTADFSF